MIIPALDLQYDLDHPYIPDTDISHLALAGTGYPLYQYRKGPLSPDFAWNLQGCDGPIRGPVPHKGLDLIYPL